MTAKFLKDIEPFFYRRRLVYVDVGAHEGEVYRRIAQSPIGIREAHLIEPNPDSFAILRETAAAIDTVKLCRCHNLALGEHPGRLRLRAADSMTKVIAVADTAEAPPGEVATEASFEIDCTTLDALSEGFERRHISILKIDVEGYEPQVLAGAAGLLRDQAVDVIYLEAGVSPQNDQQSYYRTLEDLLGAQRYRLFRLYEQANEWLDDSPLLRRVNMAFMSESFAAQNPYRLSRELFDLHKEHSVLEARFQAAETRLGEAKVRLQTSQADGARALREAETQAARLRRELAAAQAGLAEREAAEARGRSELAALRREIGDLQDYARSLEKRHGALLASTSWRATEPARRLVRLVGGRPAPKPFEPRARTLAAPAGQRGKGKKGGKVKAPAAESKAAAAPPAPGLTANPYVSKLSNLLQSKASVARGGEFIPFEVVKPATRDPAAAEGERFLFAITLASRRTVRDWAHTEKLLGKTLRSVLAQTDPDWTAIIAGHERPDLPELDDDRVEFVSIHRRPPAEKSQFRGDKSAKRHVLGRRLAEMGGGYFMQLDADDLVRDDFVATLRGRGYANGAVAGRGYALDFLNHRLAPVPGVWQHALNHVCGSCSVVRYRPEDLPTRTQKTNDSGLVFNMTRQHAYTSVAMEELGRPLEVFEDPMIVYLINHAQNLSFSLQKSGGRGTTIVEAVARHALPPEEARAILQRFGGFDWD